MYTDPVYFLNGLLDELGHEQDAEEWSYDALRPGFVGWWTANNADTGELLQVYVAQPTNLYRRVKRMIES